jgi:hypothetical protein
MRTVNGLLSDILDVAMQSRRARLIRPIARRRSPGLPRVAWKMRGHNRPPMG